MSECKECKLGDVMELVGGGTPKTTVSEYWNGSIPWLSVVDFNTGNKYVYNTAKSITQKGLENSSTKLLNEGDVIISARGTVGALAVLKKKMAFNQSCYGIKNIPDISYCDYLYYLTKDSINNLQQIAHGGVFDTITRETFNQIEILLPPLPEQRAIAGVLSSLDDKIDLLHRQNKTLEGMAEALWQKMFVEEAGARWLIAKLGDICEIQNGYAFKSSAYQEYQPGFLEVLKMGHIQPGGGLRSDPKRDYVPMDIKLKRWILNKDDIVLAMTDMKDNVVILGNPALIDKDQTYVLNQRVAKIVLKDKSKLLNPYMLYLQMKDKDFIAELQSKANSGVQVNLTTEAIKGSDIIVPPYDVQVKASEGIVCFFNQFDLNTQQIRTFFRLRDTLLPKLMSGEVRVKL